MLKITVNADDFGWSQSCSKAIISAFDQHLIQTTTMISNGAYFEEAAALLEDLALKDRVGIHFDLTEGCPLTDAIKTDPFFCGTDGSFHMHVKRYTVLNREQKQHAYEELKAQAKRFRDRGLAFHHADSHHHIHTAPNIFPIVMQVMKEFGIEKTRISRNIGRMSLPKKLLKNGFNAVLKLQNLDYTDFFGSPSDLHETPINRKNATVELMVHPDFDKTGMLIDRFGESTYEDPVGDKLSDLLEVMNERGDSLVSW